MPISSNVRRIVTTVDESGKAVVLFDSQNPHNIKRPDRPNTSRLLWVTGETPADISGPADIAWNLTQQWPTAQLILITDAGHGSGGMQAHLLAALNRFATT